MNLAQKAIEKADWVVWQRSLGDMPKLQATGILMLRVLYALVRDLLDGQLSLRAMSLVYTTLLSLVPLLAISFSVLKGFGAHNQIEPMLLSLLEPLGEKGVEITERIIEFVDNIKVGVLGSVGLGILVFTVISLMQKIERAFNFTWHVAQERTIAKRFSDYLSVIAVGPLLVFSAVGLKASVMGHSALADIPYANTVLNLVGNVLPYVLIVGAFTFIYAFVPNTRVKVGSALVGAIFAGLLWQTVGWVFAAYVISSTQYSAIYSAFATLIMFMIWLYVSWLILLLGAAIAFYHQHPQYTRLAHGQGRLGIRSQERLGLLALRVIGRSFYRAEPPWTLDRMAQEFGMPGNLMSEIIEPLERAGLIARTGDGTSPGFLPARPFDEVSAKTALDAMRDELAPGRRAPIVTRMDEAVELQLGRLDNGIAEALKGLTLKDLALAPEAGQPKARQAAD